MLRDALEGVCSMAGCSVRVEALGVGGDGRR